MKIGNWTVRSLLTGMFALDGGAMFGSVPKVLWERTNPADEDNRIALALRVLLLEKEDRKVLVDTGMGHLWSKKDLRMFRIEQPEHSLDAALSPHNLSRADITDVVFTHLHFDHAGGATLRQEKEVVPAFPNAKYYTQKSQWELANAPSAKDRASFIPNNYAPLMEHGQLETLDGDGELHDGLEILVNHGHTDGQQLVKVSGDGEALVFLGDTVPTTTHLRLPYIMGYDLRPLMTLDEKELLLTRAAEEGWWLFFDHDPEVGAVRIEPANKGYQIIDRI